MTDGRDHEFPLDPMEQAAAEATADVVVVLGGSGTGRTHTLVARVAVLLRRGASPSSIICLTLTDGGAADLGRRLEMHPETGGKSRHVYVGTVHQYANDILRNGGASGLGLSPGYTVWDQQRAVEMLELTLPPPAGSARGPALVRPEPCPVARFSRDPGAGEPLAGHRSGVHP